MQIRLHEVEHKIKILIIFCSDQILEPDYVGIAIEFPEENHFPECALGIGCILKCIEHFFDSHNVFRLLINRLPNNSISSLAQLLQNLEFS